MMKKPVSKKQGAFLRSEDKRITLLTGSVRSGKTWISLLKWALFVGSSPDHYEFIMCGKTVTSLKRNCLNLLAELVGEDNFSYSVSQKTAVLFGRRVWLEGANDARSEGKIRGLTLGGAYCDELTLFPQSFFAMLMTRLSLVGAKLYATTNPDTPTHWVKTTIIDEKKLRDQLSHWHFTLDDNDFNDPLYVESLKKEFSGVFYERYIRGEWIVAEGAVYQPFADCPEGFRVDRNQLPPLLWINIGVDFGGNRSQHAFAASGRGRDGHLYVLRSISIPAQGVDADGLIDRFRDFAAGVAAAYGQIEGVYCDSAEQTLINSIRARTPYRVYNSVKRPIVDRVRAVTLMMGGRRLHIVRGENNDLEQGLREAVWDPKSPTDKRLDNGTSNIDILDAFEYSWEYYIHSLVG